MSRTRVVLDQVEPAGVVLCIYCGARVVWALTDADNSTPVNPDPVPDGLWVLYHYAEDEPVPRQRVAYAPLHGYGQLYRGPRWKSHWATCPHREVARRAHKAHQAAARAADVGQLELVFSTTKGIH